MGKKPNATPLRVVDEDEGGKLEDNKEQESEREGGDIDTVFENLTKMKALLGVLSMIKDDADIEPGDLAETFDVLYWWSEEALQELKEYLGCKDLSAARMEN